MTLPNPDGLHATRRDHLQQLPTELLLDIVKKCPDFSALWSLINTSTRISCIFNENATEIVEAVLESVVPAPIRAVMRVVVHIRTGSFRRRSWGKATDFPPATRGGPPLDKTTSPILMRKFVHLAHKVHVLAHLCIERCLQRCRSRLGTSEPCRNPFHSRTNDGDRPQTQRCRHCRIAEELGPASWIEEQRAILSFWRVQYFFELKIGRLKGRLNWPASNLTNLQFAAIDTFFSGFVRQQVLTAVDLIEELRATDGSSSQPAGRVAFAWSVSEGPFRLPDVTKDIDPSWPCETRPILRAIERHPWGNSNYLVDATIGWTFLRELARPPDAAQLQYLPIEPYRKFGVFLWDQKMMTQLGLWPHRDFMNYDEPRVYFSQWQRLLTEDEVAQAVRTQHDDW